MTLKHPLKKLSYLVLLVFCLGFVSIGSAQTSDDDDDFPVEQPQQRTTVQKRSFFDFLFGRRPSKTSSNKSKRVDYSKWTQDELNDSFLKAAQDGKVAKMKELLAEGALINSRDYQGRTALIDAARSGNLQIVKILIDMGASINARDKYDGTALMYASRQGHFEIASLLIQNGAKRDYAF